MQSIKYYDEMFKGGDLFDTSSLYDSYYGPNGDDTLREDGPGGGGGGGILIRGGCTDRNATNYDPLATRNDGSCIYRTPEPSYETYSGNVNITLKSNVSSTKFLIDGAERGTSPISLTFTDKELQTKRTISAEKSGYTSSDRYEVFTQKKTFTKTVRPLFDLNGEPLPDVSLSDRERRTVSTGINDLNDRIFFGERVFQSEGDILGTSSNGNNTLLGQLTYTYFELNVIKILSDGTRIPVPVPNITDASSYDFKQPRNVSFQLPFSLTQNDIEVPPPATTTYTVRILGDVASNEIITYRNQKGQGGYVLNGQPIEFTFAQENGDGTPYIDLQGNGISHNTHTVKYEFRNNESNIIKTKQGMEARFELLPGNNDIQVSAVKVPSTPTPIGKPLINVSSNRLVLNIASENEIRLSYSTSDSDFVSYSLGSVQKQLEANGSLVLTKADFPNGVGTYNLFLQPVSTRDGSGDVQKVSIVVESRAWLPGPDITHINYPQNIKGADFKEYDVDFNVTWQSINTNYVNVYVGKVDQSTFLGKYTKSGKAVFNVESVLRKAGTNIDESRDITRFKLLFVPYNLEGDSVTTGKVEEINITFDKGDLKLRRGVVVNDIKKIFEDSFNVNGFTPYTSDLLTHYFHVGNGDNKLIATFGIDKDTFSEKRINPDTNQEEVLKEEKSLVLKLYEPLPTSISTNDKVWISKVQSIPVIDKITIIEDVTKNCIRLTPNFDLDLGDDVGYQIYDELISSGSTSSTSVVNEFISSSGFSLDNLELNFVTSSTYYWENFIKYSNAEERVENFYYKVKLIESYEDKINTNSNNTGFLSPAIIKENERNQTQINNIKKEFDAFEKFLFVSSSESDLTYPKIDNTGSLLHTTSSEVLSWYDGIISSARRYDYGNVNALRNNLPEHIKSDENNAEYVLFFDMIGQHFDIIHSHIKGFAQSRKLEHKLESGIKDSLIHHMLESLGWDTQSGQKSQFLWEYAFGLDKDGNRISSMSGRDRQEEIWRRILNNLPYLYKHKGTKRAINAVMSTYGVPASMLTIMEFGGPQDPTLGGTTKFSFEDRTAAINISGSASILVPWKKYNNDHPNGVEIRVQTSTRQDQTILSGDDWSLDILKDTGSLAKVQLRVGAESASTEPIPFFNDEYKSIFINRTTGSTSDTFDLYVKEAFQERIRNSAETSLTTTTLAWESGSEIIIGSGSSFTGSIDEFRLWKDPLSASLLDNHTLLPDAINGNHISSSTEDLLFRNDFEYPKNRSTSGDVYIKNVALLDDYALFSTASNFENVTSYPYNYTPYDRTVTAEVPQSGFNVGNKVRFEDQTLISNLNYKTRATRRSFDQSPIDSNRLGLFFSPIKEINMDILKSLGSFNIDNYIGDPSDEYSYEYRNLRDLRNYYFDRYTLNFQEYIQLVRYIDKSLFDVLESLVPARAKVSKGLLIEPHILERSKTDWTKPTGSNDSYETFINTQDDISISSTEDNHLALISASDDTILNGETPFYSSVVDASPFSELTGSKDDYSGTIDTQEFSLLTGSMTINSGSTMGGIEINIDAKITASITSQYDGTQNYQQVGGFGPDDLAVAGFGLYGENGESIRTYIDIFGNKIKDRVKVYLLTERYTELVPTTSGSLNGVPYFEEVTKYRKKVNILPFTGSDGLENQLRFTGSNDVVDYEALNGYFPTHYKYVGDLPTGLQNSYFNGSKQTSATTLDGGSPVQTFTTNPNTLRVTDSGRGSGEPILEVD